MCSLYLLVLLAMSSLTSKEAAIDVVESGCSHLRQRTLQVDVTLRVRVHMDVQDGAKSHALLEDVVPDLRVPARLVLGRRVKHVAEHETVGDGRSADGLLGYDLRAYGWCCRRRCRDLWNLRQLGHLQTWTRGRDTVTVGRSTKDATHVGHITGL